MPEKNCGPENLGVTFEGRTIFLHLLHLSNVTLINLIIVKCLPSELTTNIVNVISNNGDQLHFHNTATLLKLISQFLGSAPIFAALHLQCALKQCFVIVNGRFLCVINKPFLRTVLFLATRVAAEGHPLMNLQP